MDKEKKSIFGGVNRKQLSNALKKNVSLSRPGGEKPGVQKPSLNTSMNQNLSLNTRHTPTQQSLSNQKAPLQKSIIPRVPQAPPKSHPISTPKTQNVAPQPPKQRMIRRISLAELSKSRQGNTKPPQPAPQIQVQKKTIKRPLVAGRPSNQSQQPVKKSRKNKYQDHRIHNIKDHKVQNNGQRYQDQRIHNVKECQVESHGKKYQDHRLHNVKEHKVKNNGKKYQDHRLT